MVVHAISAAVLVGAASHHLIWSRDYLRGRFSAVQAEQRFALIAASAFVLTFCLGALLYPTYKVRVRAEYFDRPAAIQSESELRKAQHLGEAASPDSSVSLSSVGRLFDIKEHAVALGCAASLLLLALSRFAHPQDHPLTAPLYVGLSVFVCATVWFGAIAGIVTASYRALGGVT